MVRANNFSNILNSAYVSGIHKDASFGLSHSLKNLDGYRAEQLKKLRIEEKDLEAQLKPLQDQLKPLQDEIEALRIVREFVLSSPVKLFKPDGSALHKLVETGLAGHVMGTRLPGKAGVEAAYWVNLKESAQVFVLEHDWAAALGEGVSEGEFIFPYDVCAFEMVINTKRVIYTHVDGSNDSVFFSLNNNWGGFAVDPLNAGDEAKVVRFAVSQVRAVCISLDAEVTATAVTRAPYALNRSREKRGALPLYDFHVVSLNRRPRLASAPDDHAPGRKKRLHFRRGHWRHYEGHKTWIKWMLVGDPDLGFVDKHYRA